MARFWARWTWHSALGGGLGAALGAAFAFVNGVLHGWTGAGALPLHGDGLGLAVMAMLSGAGAARAQVRLGRRFGLFPRAWFAATLVGIVAGSVVWFELYAYSLVLAWVLAPVPAALLQGLALRRLRGGPWWPVATIPAALLAQPAAFVVMAVIVFVIDTRAIAWWQAAPLAGWVCGMLTGWAVLALPGGLVLQRLLRINGAAEATPT
jgi:hypothetical protein